MMSLTGSPDHEPSKTSTLLLTCSVTLTVVKYLPLIRMAICSRFLRTKMMDRPSTAVQARCTTGRTESRIAAESRHLGSGLPGRTKCSIV
ncbi:hypothetical protein NDU88_001289 [Pleurodeles waltl]|uniref:Uncharacterized protein n=1 Tax=Pleurodeles waltl TaxID=8319 RepID=A0AAV7SZ62_PLEWA|nr:hypothetical protein NDU88_001289 [Pleurodeles waltl]